MMPHDENTGAPRRVISADGMRHLFPALMGRGPRAAPWLVRPTAAPKRRKRRRNDDQRMLDEHVVACVAALCLYAAQDDAPDEARARLVRKFLERDQEKLKKVLERYGGYMRDVFAIEREGGADPLQTLARALGTPGSARCGSAARFWRFVPSSPEARPTLLEGLGRGGLGELANCVSDLAAAVHEEGSEGATARRRKGRRRCGSGPGPSRRSRFVNLCWRAAGRPRNRRRPRGAAGGPVSVVERARVEGGDEAPARRRCSSEPIASRVVCLSHTGPRPLVAASTTPAASANRRKPAARTL